MSEYDNNYITIRGARENNLKNINVDVPKNKLVVMTGVSGSGKTSLAFDTIYAEGQRRYVESLSAYARMFLDSVSKPDVDVIEGLSPAISIDQKTTSKNPRSTVGTITEIYDYLRILYARIGHPICPNHNIEISSQTIEEMTDKIFTYPIESRVVILAPIAERRKGTFDKTLELLRKDGYSKVIIDGQNYELDEEINLEKNDKHDILVVIDRVKIRLESRSRIYESLEAGCNLADGKVYVDIDDERLLFSEHYACPYCGFTVPKLEPSMFSFNNPLGACSSCNGLGITYKFDPSLLVPNESLSIHDGAIRYLKNIMYTDNIEWQTYKILFNHYNIDLFKPYKDLSDEEKDIILYGSKEPISYSITSSGGGITMKKNKYIEGLANLIERRYQETQSNFFREYYGSYMNELPCPVCGGKRLNEMMLSVKINNYNIHDFTSLTVVKALDFLNNLTLSENEMKIAKLAIKEIKNRLEFLQNVGLDYLTLSRKAGTLSGGEAQRIRLATQIGSHLTGVLYVLDEPSIGLHESDNHKLINSLKQMRDLGNSLIIVEHDEEIMKESDYLIDIGPLAGINGGQLMGCGNYNDFINNVNSITSDYLKGIREIALPKKRRLGNGKEIIIHGACENNLKNLDVTFPLGKLILVTGVSGSGKSTLVNETLYNAMMKKLYNSKVTVGKCNNIIGLENVDKVINIDQSPIGRTARSNPATYTGVFDLIRDIFSQTKEAKMRGYTKSRFSFNVKGGRCEKCGGDGVLRISMNFLPDVYVPCEACKGKRYNSETLECKFKDKSIADVLDMTVDEAYELFKNIPTIEPRLKTIVDVGLGYIKLGQPAPTLSGGEAQRVKLASELYKKINGNTIYILDEPTTGLHQYDVNNLMTMINRLVDNGATVIIIEHNLDVIKLADYIIDLGPGGGNNGGTLVACGTPEEIVLNENSLTGQYLKKKLNK